MGTVGVIRDVTLRKINEKNMIHFERMVALGTLSGGVAHEFNNLHAVIKGYLELVLQDQTLGAGLREHLDVVYENTQQAVEVTKHLLAFCGKQSGKQKMESLKSVINKSVRIIKREFETEGITINFQIDQDIEVPVLGGQIGQVLLNFLINARHAMMESQEKRIEIQAGVDGERAYVRLSDTGCGIPEKEISRLFDPFFTTKGEFSTNWVPL